MDVRVVLAEPEHQGNIGSIARLIQNFGFKELWLVNPKVEIGDEAKIYAVHAREVIEKVVMVKDLDEAFKDISFIVGTTAITAKKSSNVLRMPITPEELAKRATLIKGKIAVVLGRESRGLSNDELRKCDVIVTIPSSSHYRTLNVASASAIILYELWKSKIGYLRGYFEEANVEKKVRLTRLFDQLAEDAKMNSYKRRLATRSFSNVVSRAFISQREATLIMGVLRKIHLKQELAKHAVQ